MFFSTCCCCYCGLVVGFYDRRFSSLRRKGGIITDTFFYFTGNSPTVVLHQTQYQTRGVKSIRNTTENNFTITIASDPCSCFGLSCPRFTFLLAEANSFLIRVTIRNLRRTAFSFSILLGLLSVVKIRVWNR